MEFQQPTQKQGIGLSAKGRPQAAQSTGNRNRTACLVIPRTESMNEPAIDGIIPTVNR
jgi:hypothetical protein